MLLLVRLDMSDLLDDSIDILFKKICIGLTGPVNVV